MNNQNPNDERAAWSEEYFPPPPVTIPIEPNRYIPFNYSYPPTTYGLPVFNYGTSSIRTTMNQITPSPTPPVWETQPNRIVRRNEVTGEYFYEPLPVPIIISNPITLPPRFNPLRRPALAGSVSTTSVSAVDYPIRPNFISNTSLPLPMRTDSTSPNGRTTFGSLISNNSSRSSNSGFSGRIERERERSSGSETTIGHLLMGVGSNNGETSGSGSRESGSSGGERSRASSASLGSMTADLSVPSIKPFAQKLASMLRNPQLYGDLIFWDPSGTHFLLLHGSNRLSKEVLPLIFSHSSLQAFQRQLNIYEFKHLPPATLIHTLSLYSSNSSTLQPLPLPDSNYSGYFHPNFLKSDIDSLPSFSNLAPISSTPLSTSANGGNLIEFGNSLLALLKPRPSRARALKKREKEMVER